MHGRYRLTDGTETLNFLPRTHDLFRHGEKANELGYIARRKIQRANKSRYVCEIDNDLFQCHGHRLGVGCSLIGQICFD
jgi:hypothetical protein